MNRWLFAGLLFAGALPAAQAASPLVATGLKIEASYETRVTVGATPNDALPTVTDSDSAGSPPPSWAQALLLASLASPVARSGSAYQMTSQPFWCTTLPGQPEVPECPTGVWTPTDEFHFRAEGRSNAVNAGLEVQVSGHATYDEAAVSPPGLNQGVLAVADSWTVFHFRLVPAAGQSWDSQARLSWAGSIHLDGTQTGGGDLVLEGDAELVIIDASGRRERRAEGGVFSFSESVQAGAEVFLGVGVHAFYSGNGLGGGTQLMADWEATVRRSALAIDGVDLVFISTVPEPATEALFLCGLAGLLACGGRRRLFTRR